MECTSKTGDIGSISNSSGLITVVVNIDPTVVESLVKLDVFLPSKMEELMVGMHGGLWKAGEGSIETVRDALGIMEEVDGNRQWSLL